MSDITIRNQTELKHYEAVLNGEVVAFAEYRPLEGAVMFAHTEVNESIEGKGIGSALIRQALDETRAAGKWVIPMCPFVVGFIQRHPEYVEAVNPQHRRIFGI
ncbi:N-acetyltransferase [Deinococcus cellulosilyticus NBRC 106333 = KACC 11606]|uniref:N-acetyltransferase n=1 Tax=Deinococcus cellulosilyticus (strain DSM 18568 / NBRC 106333 / KACC 11606 / 5516J-15) TaxID=1223518 RepID=A0A511NAB5_DEIC1|nr:N-acetyltransferase [Deinococcus cellulosilyticus NBRC 106333 = KACC 11606]